jgi:serine phosphatase RsbU (regulator of sigma subunit)/anti-sigma regulatory factor (Ser/Thr protein kinase)
MIFSVSSDPYGRADPRTHGGSATTADRDDYLAVEARRAIAALDASAVVIYLLEPGERALRAAVVVVQPLGVGSIERIPLEDESYASAAAFQSGQLESAYSSEEIGRHPELAVFAPFPFTVSSVPLHSPAGRLGVVAAYWPVIRHQLSAEQRRCLTTTAESIAWRLNSLAARGASMAGVSAPYVVAASGTGVGRDPLSEAGASAPLMYHLQKLTIALNQASHINEAVSLVIERLMTGFSAQAVAITMLDTSRLSVVGAAGCPQQLVRELNGRSLSELSPETEALVSMEQALFDTPEALERRYPELSPRGDYAWAVLPLMSVGKAVGSCSLGFRPGGSDALLQPAILTALATMLGQTLDRTRLNDAQHMLARKLQQALLPRTLPQISGVLSTTRYVASNRGVELGGDWYDLINLPDGGIGAVVGDVQGHNITAAVVMGQLRSAVRAYATEGHDPGTVLARTNRLLLELDTERFATCCLVWLYPDTGMAKIATAGHHVPVIHPPQYRLPSEEMEVGIPLGINPDAYYKINTITLDPGTLFVLYTDGLAEAEARDSMAEQTEETISAELARDEGAELETLGDRLIGGAISGTGRADDAALLLVRYEGQGEGTERSVRSLEINRRDLQGVKRTRAFLREWLSVWELGPMTEPLELLASEVVTNALVHGDSDVDIHVRRYPERIRVEVRDSDPKPALPVGFPSADDESEGGRGLIIVSAMASAWGNSPSGRGKTVWFEMLVPDGPEPVDESRIA